MSDTLAEIRAAVYDRIDVTPSDPRLPVATMDRFINAALRKASTTFDPYWLETSQAVNTVASQNYIALSGLAAFHKMSRVVYDTQVLRFVSKHEIAQYLPFSEQRPQVWAVEQERLMLGPTPDAVYALTCYYYRLEDPLTDEADQPLLPSQYTDWLVVQAGEYAATKMGDEKKVALLRTQRKDWFDDIRNDIRQVRPLPRVRVRDQG
jgi:hypothetical protein